MSLSFALTLTTGFGQLLSLALGLSFFLYKKEGGRAVGQRVRLTFTGMKGFVNYDALRRYVLYDAHAKVLCEVSENGTSPEEAAP